MFQWEMLSKDVTFVINYNEILIISVLHTGFKVSFYQ